MIVVATHNSRANIDRLLWSMRTHGTDNEAVLLVVSGDPEYREYIDSVCQGNHGLRSLEWIEEPTNGFEAGAWIQAYRSRFDNTYLFLQDSIEVTAPGWYEQFVRAGIVACDQGFKEFCIPWVTFAPYMLGVTADVAQRIMTVYGLYSEPGFGIFGSMFYTNRPALERIEKAGYMNYPAQDKIDSEAYERWWALFFHRLGIPMFPIHANGYQLIHERGDGLFGMRKHFHSRNGGQR